MKDNRKIGIIDSGVGGLTVAKEFRLQLPQENILYLGDNINVPYGNKSEEEIYKLTKKMIDFLIERDVKLIAVACNTISSILDKYFLDSKLPIVSIINPVVEYVEKKGFKEIGIIATEFTISSKKYEDYLYKKDKDIKVVTESSPFLAEIIDRGDFTDREISREISKHMDNILKKRRVKDIILGCTHYPIVLDKFKEIAPEINFINPAYEQALYAKKLMKERDILNNRKDSTFEIYTTDKKDSYLKLIKKLSIEMPDNIYEVEEY